ncbi:MAG TPA: thermonuclease family protein [Thermoflexus sp.]|nr:thermonuclease family protein [Thermoflexus sp.]
MREEAPKSEDVLRQLGNFLRVFAVWWWGAFRGLGCGGKIVLITASLVALGVLYVGPLLLCSAPLVVLGSLSERGASPTPLSFSASAPTATVIHVPSVPQLAPTESPSPMSTTTSTLAPEPTSTASSTPAPSPTPSSTTTPTQIPTATPTPLPRPTATWTPEIRSDDLRAIPGAECLPPGRSAVSARLVRVIDGDTIDVAIEGRTFRVRYIGMNTPERGQPFFIEAAEANRRLVAGRTLLLVPDVSETDPYGRLLRYVIAGDLFVNLALVREGYAAAMIVPPDVSCAEAFRAAEAEARAAGRGLWGLPTPTPTRATLPTPTALPAGGNCHPAYPTVCIPPPPPDLDCADIPYRNFPVDHRYGDPHRFDGDGDGIGCER